jgi:amino-acid carrier protein alsT
MMTKSVKIVNNLTGIEWQNGLLADIANAKNEWE